MAFLRYTIDLAISLKPPKHKVVQLMSNLYKRLFGLEDKSLTPEDVADYERMPEELQKSILAVEEHVRILKSFSQKVNAGKFNEENTIKATKHICLHDEELPCEPERHI